MQAGRDGTYSLVPVSSEHAQAMQTVDSQGNPIRSSMLDLSNHPDGDNILSAQLIEGEKGPEVRYCVVLEPSFAGGDGSGQPTAITLPDGSYAYVNALPSTDVGAENGCLDGSGGYTLQLYDDNRHLGAVDSSGGLQSYQLDLDDPEVTLTSEEIQALMLEGDTLSDRLLTGEEDFKIDSAIEQ